MTTEERLEKLERELAAAKRCNRWMLTVVLLIVGGLGLVWTLTKTTSVAYAQELGTAPKIVRANMFVIVDENGKERVILTANKERVALSLFDENSSKPRAALTVDETGPVLSLRNKKGDLCATLGAIKGISVLSLFNENGELRAMLGVEKDEPRMKLFDEKGKERAILHVFKTQPELCLWDENNKSRAVLTVNEVGPGLSLRDENDKLRAALVVGKDGPALGLWDENEKPRAALAVDKDGPGLGLSDEKGKVIWSAP